uniref:C2H2-type domain-containing protein n=1 Tax=Scophthalmus maximus TaxID=52904 RepID=A0A8D3BP18_SCOMX
MCQDRCLRVAYPCMVQDCDSVVTYSKSLHRHYIKVHRIGREKLSKNEDKLVFTAEHLHSIKADTQEEDNHDPLGFPEAEEEEPPLVERNGVLVGADEVLYGEANASSNKEVGKMLNGSATTPTPVRQPLKRKNELSEPPSNMKEPQPRSPSPRSFDIGAYKPIGFESSFLKFIQDTSPKDKNPVPMKRRDTFRRSCSVKENNQLGISHTRSRRTHSPLLKPHAMTGELTSVENLKSILDKALAGCGDLAIKQLQYLRPVVLLGRPVSTTTHLFPSDTNNSKLLFGS